MAAGCCAGEESEMRMTGQAEGSFLAPGTQYLAVQHGEHDTLILPGNMNVATRVYTGKDIFKVVRLQANIRRFLAQRRLYHILMNPE